MVKKMTLLSASLPLDIKDALVARHSARREPWQVAFDREIGPEDLVLLQGTFYAPTNTKAPLAAIRDPHHTLARLVAQDKAVVEISAITGYTPSRIYTLKADPAFRELVAHYAEQEASAKADVHQQIQATALTALQILHERLEETPDEFSNKELREILTAGFDRTGFGPSSKVDVRFNDTAKIIEQTRLQLEAERQGRVISKTEITTEFSYVEAPESDGLADSDYDADWAVAQPTEAERLSSGGDQVPEASPG